MPIDLQISPTGQLRIHETGDPAALDGAAAPRIRSAFEKNSPEGLLHLATTELQTALTPPFSFARDFARGYLTRLCQTPLGEALRALPPVEPPSPSELATLFLQAPPMQGLEYLTTDALGQWWRDLDAWVRVQAANHPAGIQAFLSERNPQWRLVGRVTLHLAENKRDPVYPFAFLATYSPRLSSQGRVQHQPLSHALQEYAGAKNRAGLLALLTPIQRACEKSALVKELADSGDIYSSLAWTPREAYRFLQEIPIYEQSGLIVRIPDWWNPRRPPRPVVSVKIDGKNRTTLGVSDLLSFQVNMTLDGETLTDEELRAILDSVGGLVSLKGRWVEVDRDKLASALAHWKDIEKTTRRDGLTFYEGMRLLSGAPLDRDAAAGTQEIDTRDWIGLTAGPALEQTLRKLRAPESCADGPPEGLRGELRPYQQAGVGWLRFVTSLGLGACLADDMGLGKTLQVIGLLLHRKAASRSERPRKVQPSLLVIPASLIGNWKSELGRFAPELRYLIVHPSESSQAQAIPGASQAHGTDLVITTYSMLTRLAWLREYDWDLAILDEAQAIKNSATRQTRAAKELRARARVAMTGTPVENRLSDLWSLFDFLNPGLLGSAKAFAGSVKRMEDRSSYEPLRMLVGPYILRRLKTDKRVIDDLPEKVEIQTFCPLSREQAALYEHAVETLETQLEEASGIERRGIVLANLMRLKQICNHPAQVTGSGDYDPIQSGKFQRLAALCEELSERQEKVLIFTQFREITEPLAHFLQGTFGRAGLVLHGGTRVAVRRQLIESFQSEDGPPFFVLSLKAGGTGLNLTAASHVIHFDRWWNPAVENQATDRAFRIGQMRNVLVHKFVCRGTVEEKIDAIISEKKTLAEGVIGGAESMLTEMTDKQLLEFIRLDINKALDT
jgi:non-specific serine/threonine protein kinase